MEIDIEPQIEGFLASIEQIEESLGEFVVGFLSEQLQSEGGDAKELERVKEIEKSISKAQRALIKAKQSLAEITEAVNE